jgi:hypothetical protein
MPSKAMPSDIWENVKRDANRPPHHRRNSYVDNQILLEVARLVSVQSKLLVVVAGAMLVGLVVLGLQLRAISADLKAIAAMTAEVLRRTPER